MNERPSKPRVTHILSGDLWAGAEVASYHLLCALAKRRDVHVEGLILNEGELTTRLEAAGVPTAVEPEAERPFVSLVQAIRRRVRGADLVHAHRYKENLLAACSGRPWVATQHGRPEPLHGRAALRMAVYVQLDLLAKRFSARRIIAVSGEVERWLHERLRHQRIVRVWNGIEDPLDSESVQAWTKRPRRVGCIGRLFPVKALHVAIDAVAACQGIELEIVGEGPERPAFERRIAASGAGQRIRLLGFEANPLPRLASWRALLLPSLHEGNPVSVIEALALGTPVLAAELPGVAEMLAGQAGWIIQTRDPRVWAERLQDLMDRPALGESRSRAARERYTTTFTAAQAAERTLGVYRGALAPTRSRESPR